VLLTPQRRRRTQSNGGTLNLAAESNISLSELTATLSVLSNNGIRAGSTLGTGVRQLIVAIEEPSAKLKARLDQLGISMEQVDIKSDGLVGVLKNLQAGGFTTADAFASIVNSRAIVTP
jgi:TP901 family phage tail tape measure protein